MKFLASSVLVVLTAASENATNTMKWDLVNSQQ